MLKNTKNYKAGYFTDLYKLSYSYKKNKITYRYTYTINISRLEVEVYSENNTIIEKYSYDATNNKIMECVVGSCNDYEEAMNLLNKDILNYLYE